MAPEVLGHGDESGGFHVLAVLTLDQYRHIPDGVGEGDSTSGELFHVDQLPENIRALLPHEECPNIALEETGSVTLINIDPGTSVIAPDGTQSVLRMDQQGNTIFVPQK